MRIKGSVSREEVAEKMPPETDGQFFLVPKGDLVQVAPPQREGWAIIQNRGFYISTFSNYHIITFSNARHYTYWPVTQKLLYESQQERFPYSKVFR